MNDYVASDYEDFNETIETIHRFSVLLYILGYMVTVVTFLMWFYRSYDNLKKIGIHIESSVNMSVFGFIIPIINFSRPVKIAKEIDFKYDNLIKDLDNSHQINENNYTIIVAWYIGYWVVNIFHRFTSRLESETVEQIIEEQLYEFVGNGLLTISIILTIILIKTIGKSETKLENLISLEELNQLGSKPE